MKLIFTTFWICFAFSIPNTAYAYIDPVTGSFILQGLLAGFAASMVFFRSLREKVKSFFGFGSNKNEEVSDDEKPDNVDGQ